ncbi:type II secretion system F family protein [Arthrobacter sp. FW306-05-C]|uniref:type II secretion system F family protein n=1 Tax=Arthrobacter TaxID=1663 RepID=UPI001EF0EBC5|nr:MULTISPECIES: type II secretion system F family protein [Arthrobacter]MDP9985512.1 pilus assembly protein TadC [Arthrobacter oryzae]UKA66153.1 type II secretion system F family protein [Arthrobacter sp. FW306-05-C]UKA70503.1 type II secretion system F family protein [Arthrobacter sp. FW306-06-A]UKA74805.1 type II secretion system F family protein [Arthrobacter sp. FW306-07-I]
MSTGLGPGLALFLLLAAGAWLACSSHDRSRQRLRRLAPPVPGAKATAGPGSSHGRGLNDTAMMLELVAAMLDAGAGIGRSLELVAASAAPEYRDSLRPVVSALAIGADWETAWRSSAVRSTGILELRDALAFAALTGAPSSAILYAQAARLRRERFRAAEKRAASLGVKLVVPLGLCSLPAFICLGVVPVLLALVPSGS